MVTCSVTESIARRIHPWDSHRKVYPREGGGLWIGSLRQRGREGEGGRVGREEHHDNRVVVVLQLSSYYWAPSLVPHLLNELDQSR